MTPEEIEAADSKLTAKILELLDDRLFLRMTSSDEQRILLSCLTGVSLMDEQRHAVDVIFKQYGY